MSASRYLADNSLETLNIEHKLNQLTRINNTLATANIEWLIILTDLVANKVAMTQHIFLIAYQLRHNWGGGGFVACNKVANFSGIS